LKFATFAKPLENNDGSFLDFTAYLQMVEHNLGAVPAMSFGVERA